MDLNTEFSSNQAVLLLISGLEYNEMLVSSLKQLKGSICYVTTNKTSDSLKEIFKKNKIATKEIIFIDAISKTIKKVGDQGENVYFVSSPGALTELSLVVDKFLKHGFDYFIFDSITNLSVYQKTNISTKFITDLVNKVKKTKTKALLYALDSKEQAALINHTAGLVDKVVKASEVK